ncbi:hypothetical protein PAXRUDRAFT_17919 [Paxillus rubicundulus Ve08.2h10]|uniref:Unplaced genomic scaffold scaffold_2455, whole genome shotgun sequence n=1 Tax=Paxillus rubicundulus Ve08.2h10 TaxID=930991 RepID=A0A0D0D8T6_9AGAM|nr:hypothetical protein PAXRUDRAFT_17919 [Paxillus rubicundulus Ve08.2h10]
MATPSILRHTQLDSFCTFAHIDATLNWEIEQLDIKTAFLNGLLDKDDICYVE